MPDTTSPAPATNTDKPKTIGQVAYEAYGDSRAWKTATGSDMPKWSEQRPELCEAWEAAAQAVQPIVPEPGLSKGLQLVVSADDIAAFGFGALADRAHPMLRDMVRAIETFQAEAPLRDACRAKGVRLTAVAKPIA